MIARPRGLNEAWPAAGGAAALLALGFLRPEDLVAVGRETGGVLLFLLGMLILSAILELAGVFARAASWAVYASRASARRLLVNIFLLGALVTGLLSLDVTVIMLTPVVYATVTALEVDPLPFLYACAFVANTGSLIFPMSNLTNLLVVDRLGLPFWPFAFVMAFPNAVAVAVNVVVFLWLFRDRLPRTPLRSAVGGGGVEVPRPFFLRSVLILSLVLAGLLLSGLEGRPLWPVALGGAAVLLWVARAAGVPVAATVINEVPWTLFPFVLGMAAIVRGIEHASLTAGLDRLIRAHSGAHVGDLVAVGGLSAVGANLFNNIPMTLVMLGVLAAGARVPIGLAAATLIGVNIGPALTTVGSLATILWLTIVRRRGTEVSVLQYLRIAGVTVPLVLAAALGALILETLVR